MAVGVAWVDCMPAGGGVGGGGAGGGGGGEGGGDGDTAGVGDEAAPESPLPHAATLRASGKHSARKVRMTTPLVLRSIRHRGAPTKYHPQSIL